jgi:hypothetical protein
MIDIDTGDTALQLQTQLLVATAMIAILLVQPTAPYTYTPPTGTGAAYSYYRRPTTGLLAVTVLYR